MPLGNGSRVRTSSGATVMGSNLRLNKFPLANVNDSSSHAGQVATQPQGQHLVNITTIYGDLGQSKTYLYSFCTCQFTIRGRMV